MPWFESSEQKKLRLLIEGKMKMCFENPQRYKEGMNIILTYIRSSNQSVIEMVVDKIKEVIKDEDRKPRQKHQAILLLKDLMETHNKSLGKYVIKKILKRLIIFAQHKKHIKSEQRGKDIFGSCKKNDQVHCINFLNTLLLGFEDWGTKWTKQVNGPQKQFHEARNQLLMGGVTFPKEKKVGKEKGKMEQGRHSGSFQQPKNPPIIQQTKVQEPKATPIPKEIEDYFRELIESLKLFHTFLEQNLQYDEASWEMTKQIAEQIKILIEKGDKFLAKLMAQDADTESPLLKKFQRNSKFLEGLKKNISAVTKKSQKYNQFCAISIRESKKIINSLSVHVPNQENLVAPPKLPEKPKIEKVEQPPATTQKIQPKIKEKNRFDSTHNLQTQLDQIKKEKSQYGSGSHQSSKFGSVSPGMFDKSKYDGNNNKDLSPNEKQGQKKQSPKGKEKKLGSISQITQQNESVFKGVSMENIDKQQNKQSEVKKKSKQGNFFEEQGFPGQQKKVQPFEKDDFFDGPPPSKSKNKNENTFDNFQNFQKGKEKSQSSDFFKEVQKKENINKLPGKSKRTPHQKKKQDDPFDVSIKSKVPDEDLSVFGKNDSNKMSSKDNVIEKQDVLPTGRQIDFDTFKKPSPSYQPKQEASNPFQVSKTSNKGENPFDDSLNKSIGVVSKDGVSQHNKSKSSNPFSSKAIEKMQNSFQLPPPLNKKKSEVSNPFDQKSVSAVSQNPFEKKTESNPFETNMNPFDQRTQNPNNSVDFMRKSPQFDNLSRSNSFKNIEKVEIEKKPDLAMDNPFESVTKQKKNEIFANAQDPLRQSGPQFIHMQKQSEVNNLRDTLVLQPQEYVRDSVRENIRDSMSGFRQSFGARSSGKGFDFDDFANFNKSGTIEKPNSKQNQSNLSRSAGINFDDFGDFNPKQSNNFFGKSDKEQKISSLEKQVKKSEEAQKQNQQKKQEFNFSDFDKFSQKKSEKEDNNPFSSFDEQKSSLTNKEGDQQKKQKQERQKKGRKTSEEKDFFDKSRENRVPQIALQQKSREEVNWNDFGNFTQNNDSKIEINESNEEQKKQKLKAEEKKISVSKEQKQITYSQFQDINAPKKQMEASNISRITKNNDDIRVSDNLATLRDINQKLENKQIKHQITNNPLQQSISINIEDGSPSAFQKKGIKWELYLAIAPVSTIRNKVSREEIEAKRKEFEEAKERHEKKTADYQELKNEQNELREQYHKKLERISMINTQKTTYSTMVQRLKQSNEIKEKQIEQLLKRIKKGQQIRKSILEKQKLLFDRGKLIQQQRTQQKVQNKNKWERFNSNLQKQKNTQTWQSRISSYGSGVY